ncbi:hypothetical protein B0T16DRAFT_178162 [Cercophora newfieldiana]|uniref:Uncharacterized protein n=1 Tax=Cercophora newfieldiana TaxID=92897 RepID=A0AA39Y246_9PEZI|nr:hypothetical protein B0T16DRAFT_178162 [Cercophora newfieldiana]
MGIDRQGAFISDPFVLSLSGLRLVAAPPASFRCVSCSSLPFVPLPEPQHCCPRSRDKQPERNLCQQVPGLARVPSTPSLVSIIPSPCLVACNPKCGADVSATPIAVLP